MGLLIVVPMFDTQITEVATTNVGVIHIGLALHLLPDGIRNGLGCEAVRSILALHTECGAKPEHDDG